MRLAVFGGQRLCACAFVLLTNRPAVISDGKACGLLPQEVGVDSCHRPSVDLNKPYLQHDPLMFQRRTICAYCVCVCVCVCVCCVFCSALHLTRSSTSRPVLSVLCLSPKCVCVCVTCNHSFT